MQRDPNWLQTGLIVDALFWNSSCTSSAGLVYLPSPGHLRVAMAHNSKSVIEVVVIDDDERHLKMIAAALSTEEIQVLTTTIPREGLDLIRQHHPPVVLVDLIMPGTGGMEILEQALAFDPRIDVILLTGQYGTDSAVEAIQKGACDYLTKPVSVPRLRQWVEASLQERRQLQRCGELDRELLESSQFESMVGRSPLMIEVFFKVRRVAKHFRTVLITGETGVGKELVARALHKLSPVASGPFITCNCSALVETLAESELFGYSKGAFTGANQDRIGLFEAANGGTIFLDEIGELSLQTQAKLLRVLQNSEVQRVGSTATRRIDVKVIAATHRDLKLMTKERTFREDLFYRLSMIEINVPSLAQRKEDLPLLEQHFVKHYAQQYHKPIAGITRRAQAVLSRHSWPGNVRELENVLGNACMMADGEAVDTDDLPEYLLHCEPSDKTGVNSLASLEAIKRWHARRTLDAVSGNKVRAAEILGISRGKLYRLLGEADSSSESERKSYSMAASASSK
jgi:DNA-binding NtrC family response regulator